VVTDHPRDSRGRVSPDPSWPGDRAAPGRLELVRRFCNTTNRENGADRLTEPDGLGRWCRTEGLPPGPVTDLDLHRIVAARELLHGLARAHTSGAAETDLPGLAELLSPVRFIAIAGPDGLDLEVHTPDSAELPRTARARRRRRAVPRYLDPAQGVPALRLGHLRRLQEPQRAMVLDHRVRRSGTRAGLPQA
jgi:hypothetical protein